MNVLKSIWEEGVGLFVDDGALAALCVGLIAVLTVAVLLLKLSGFIAGLILAAGCIVILVWSVLRAIRS